ncbi:5'-methylthioadenosine/adenosylhomocysteine nucleosidase [Halalkalibacillus halophilus]|uniref:5'-methylthioadenosine/adenosylhomocysteine nucleosidase n=1 Tax=Halalkalibacillus halophilus TaxID=392827 RepID=UPI0004154C6B|nr:5'-methylthioadenosine/adenosylhomocysteine nucleosidase [Halalkalibacillus halophilus]
MKYGIIGAMQQEVQWLLSQINVTNEVTIANCRFYEGTFAGKEVVLLQSGIGKVNAAMSTTILHEQFQPDYIINTGSSGGTDPDLNVGDIVIGEQTIYHDADARGFGYEYGQIPQMPLHYFSDGDLIQKAEQVKSVLPPDIQVVKGLIGTGDSFMSEIDRVEQVKSLLIGVKALEMEATAIAQVCFQYKTPCLIIRSLSDIAGKESNISFEQYLEKAAKNSASFILEMLK